MPGNAPDKSQRYEELRSQAIDDHRTAVASTVVSAAVLVRQGMSAWMQLRETQQATQRAAIGDTEQHHSGAFPAPQHTELLAVLTGLVFDIRNQKESA